MGSVMIDHEAETITLELRSRSFCLQPRIERRTNHIRLEKPLCRALHEDRFGGGFADLIPFDLLKPQCKPEDEWCEYDGGIWCDDGENMMST